jgi:hypothetical protein
MRRVGDGFQFYQSSGQLVWQIPAAYRVTVKEGVDGAVNGVVNDCGDGHMREGEKVDLYPSSQAPARMPSSRQNDGGSPLDACAVVVVVVPECKYNTEWSKTMFGWMWG